MSAVKPGRLGSANKTILFYFNVNIVSNDNKINILMKTRHLDADAQPLFKLIEMLGRKHDYATVFDDFLTIALTQFVSPDCEIGKKWHASAIKNYDDEEKKSFSLMFAEMIKAYQVNITDDGQWYDLFGDTYMMIAGRWKSSHLGQFFTPESICDLITGTYEKSSGKTVSDPTCGSGRMLISHHVKNLGNYYVGEDLDLMCCKMTALNFLLHGTCGEVCHHNSLTEPDTFRHRFVVNKYLNKGFGIPHVQLQESGIWHHRRYEKKVEMQQETQAVITPAPVFSNQLSFF